MSAAADTLYGKAGSYILLQRSLRTLARYELFSSLISNEKRYETGREACSTTLKTAAHPTNSPCKRFRSARSTWAPHWWFRSRCR
jgi:hypothetical protein